MSIINTAVDNGMAYYREMKDGDPAELIARLDDETLRDVLATAQSEQDRYIYSLIYERMVITA